MQIPFLTFVVDEKVISLFDSIDETADCLKDMTIINCNELIKTFLSNIRSPKLNKYINNSGGLTGNPYLVGYMCDQLIRAAYATTGKSIALIHWPTNSCHECIARMWQKWKITMPFLAKVSLPGIEFGNDNNNSNYLHVAVLPDSVIRYEHALQVLTCWNEIRLGWTEESLLQPLFAQHPGCVVCVVVNARLWILSTEANRILQMFETSDPNMHLAKMASLNETIFIATLSNTTATTPSIVHDVLALKGYTLVALTEKKSRLGLASKLVDTLNDVYQAEFPSGFIVDQNV